MSTRSERTRERTPVAPSTRDGIDRWLDVLTSMLNLPHGERIQVRDELEDHLRSRVDDLLIAGMPEPDAIRAAVNELGETAELAVLISSAHTQSRTRRHIMHLTLAAAAIAGMTFGGLSLLNPRPQPATPIGQTVAANAGVTPIDLETARSIQFESEPFLVGFQRIAEAFDLDIKLDSLERDQVRQLQGRQVSMAGSFSLSRALQSLFVQSLQHAADLGYEVNDGTLELLTHDERERRTVRTEVFTLPTTDEHDALQAASAMRELLRARVDSRWLTVQQIDGAVAVAVPKSEFEHVARVWSLIEGQLREAREERQQALERLKAKKERSILKIKSENESARRQYVDRLDEQSRLREELAGVNNVFSPSLPAQEQAERGSQSNAIQSRLRELDLELKELELRIERLQGLLFDAEYADLMTP